MENFDSMTNEELLAEKKKLQNSKIFHASAIGFLAGVLLFGFVAWLMNPEKKIGFLIPMAIPVVFIYRMLKNPKNNKNLEAVLQKRKL